MTKRMIDADALDEWLGRNFEYCEDIHGIEKLVVSYGFLLKKIKELSTPAPEPQQSIFDADGWCWDMDLVPDRQSVILCIDNPCFKRRATTGMRIDKEFSFAMVSERDNPVAWKLLTIPKEA